MRLIDALAGDSTYGAAITESRLSAPRKSVQPLCVEFQPVIANEAFALSRQAVNPRRRERDAIVGANRVRQAMLAEQTVEHRAHAESLGREEAVTREQVARVLVGDGEWVTVHTIAGAKLALEVRGPEIIGVGGLDRDDTGMLDAATRVGCADAECRAAATRH